MSVNSEQLELLTNRAEMLSAEAQGEIAKRCKDRHDALIRCFTTSGLEPKQVYSQILDENGKAMSQTRFSLFMNRKASLPHSQEHKYMRACGNLIPVYYDAHVTQHGLVPIKTDAEERVKQLEQELADRDRAIRLLGEMLRGNR